MVVPNDRSLALKRYFQNGAEHSYLLQILLQCKKVVGQRRVLVGSLLLRRCRGARPSRCIQLCKCSLDYLTTTDGGFPGDFAVLQGITPTIVVRVIRNVEGEIPYIRGNFPMVEVDNYLKVLTICRSRHCNKQTFSITYFCNGGVDLSYWDTIRAAPSKLFILFLSFYELVMSTT